MNIRKAIAGLLAALTGLSALTACGNTAEGSTTAETTEKSQSAIVNELEDEPDTKNTQHETATNVRKVTTTTTKKTTTTTTTTTTVATTVAAKGTKGPTIEICDMHAIGESHFSIEDEGIKDSYGNTYLSNIAFMDASYNAFVKYDLDGRFEGYSAKLVTSDRTGSGAKMNVAFFADGKKIYSITDMTRQKAPQNIDIDLRGVKHLEIKTSNSGEFSYGWLFLVESEFEKAEKPAECKEIHRLNELVVIDSSNYDNIADLSRDSYGELHNGCQFLDASYSGFVLYNLNKQYSNLSGYIAASEKTGSNTSMNIEIYADDELVFECTGINRQSRMIPFECDVSNAQTLKIVSSNLGEFSYGHIWIVDDELK